MAALVAPSPPTHPTTFSPPDTMTATTFLEPPPATPPTTLSAPQGRAPLLSPLQAKDVQPPASLLAAPRVLDFDFVPYEDKIHGLHSIRSPCILKLINHPSFERLKHVLQHGITALVRLTEGVPVTRYEHSIGAMIAVAKAGGTEEAQIAALLHDVAHTALSHVADQVFGYVVHEDDKDSFLQPSGLKDILLEHGFDPARVLHEENFPLLELDTPRVCADRFDYGLRDSVAFGKLSLSDARAASNAIIPFQRSDEPSPTMAMRQEHQHLALKLARAYLASDRFAWANPKHGWLYHLAAEAIKNAMHKDKTLLKKDLWWPTDHSSLQASPRARVSGDGDETFWRLLQASGTPETQRLAARVHCRYDLRPVPSPPPRGSLEEWEEIFEHKVKCRTLDPDIMVRDGEGRAVVKRLSELDAEWRREREAHVREVEGGRWFVVTDLPKKEEIEARRSAAA